MRAPVLALAFAAVHAVVPAGCSRGASAADAGPTKSDAERYAQYMVNYPFGGQRPEWWEQAIADARPGGASPDPARYALLLERAKRNGLVVVEKHDGANVRPGPELAQKLLERVGVR